MATKVSKSVAPASCRLSWRRLAASKANKTAARQPPRRGIQQTEKIVRVLYQGITLAIPQPQRDLTAFRR